MSDALFDKGLLGKSLREVYIVPPFSVIQRSGETNPYGGAKEDWTSRKARWLQLGIQSELGRAEGLITDPGSTSAYVGGGKWNGRTQQTGGTSVFDPVLAEIAYVWFCPPGGYVVDPFAGGSVRGVVAALLGFHYFGCDLSAEQVAANREQAHRILSENPCEGSCSWEVGDCREVLPQFPAGSVDFVFSCPPYFDLEVYSDDPKDLSAAKSYGDFLAGYYEAIRAATMLLKRDRFAAFVVGDVRDRKSGLWRRLPAATCDLFERAGLGTYNEIIVRDPGGSDAVRAKRIFDGGRKVVKVHQELLVFVKGDPKVAATAAKGERVRDEEMGLAFESPQLGLLDAG